MTIKKPHLQDFTQFDLDRKLTSVTCTHNKSVCFVFPSRLQLLLFLKGFTESERNKLAMLTGILLANGNISASILNSLYNENLVKEGEEETSQNINASP